MLLKDKKLASRKYAPFKMILDDKDVIPFDVQGSLEKLKEKLNNSTLVLQEERVEGCRQFQWEALAFSERYGVDVNILQRTYYVEVCFNGLGGCYPREFSADFAKLMGMCDRFSICSSEMTEHHIMIGMEYDTHNFYVGGKKFNDVW